MPNALASTAPLPPCLPPSSINRKKQTKRNETTILSSSPRPPEKEGGILLPAPSPPFPPLFPRLLFFPPLSLPLLFPKSHGPWSFTKPIPVPRLHPCLPPPPLGFWSESGFLGLHFELPVSHPNPDFLQNPESYLKSLSISLHEAKEKGPIPSVLCCFLLKDWSLISRWMLSYTKYWQIG